MYKVRNNLFPSTCSHHIKPTETEHEYALRNQSEFCVIHVKTRIRENFIARSGPTVWNSIPEDIKIKTSITAFKKAMKAWLISQY